MTDAKRTISLESVSTSGTNNSAFFCQGIDSHEMKYSMSDEGSETSGLVNTLSRSTEEFIGSTRKSELSFASSHSAYNYNKPSNVNTIFRHQTGPTLRLENSEISIANPVGGSSSEGTSQSNTPIPVAPQSIVAKHADKYPVVSTTRKPWFSLSKNGSSVFIPLNESNHESTISCQMSCSKVSTKNSSSTASVPSFSRSNPRIEKETSEEEHEQQGISNVSNDKLFDPFIFHRSHEDTSAAKSTTKLTKHEKELMDRIQNHIISVSNISNSLSSQTEDTIPVQSSTEESNNVTSYFGSIFCSFRDKMNGQKDKMVEQCNSLGTTMNSFSSNIASCCSSNISSAIVANRKCTQHITQQIPTISKVSGNSSSADDFLIIEQMAKDVGIEISELYNFLKQYYFDYHICSDHSQRKDDSIYLITSSETNDNSSSCTENLEHRSSMDEAKNFSINQFIREVDSCAEKLGISRTEFLNRVTSMISNKSNVVKKVDTEDTAKESNHLNNLRIAGALITEDESVLLKNDSIEVSNCKIHSSKSTKGHTRIGLGKQVGVEKKKKPKFVQKGRFRLIT
jgi:hypothetical protein